MHVVVPEEVHQRVRVKAALEDASVQTPVARIFTEAVSDVVLPSTIVRERLKTVVEKPSR